MSSKPAPGPSWENWMRNSADADEAMQDALWARAKAARDFLLWAENVAESTRRMLAGLETMGYRLGEERKVKTPDPLD